MSASMVLQEAENFQVNIAAKREKQSTESNPLDAKLSQGIKSAVTDTKFESLDFVVGVGEPQKEGVMGKRGSVDRISLYKDSRLWLLLFFAGTAFSIAALARSSSAPFVLFYPRVEFGAEWKTSFILFNSGQSTTRLRLFAYDASGNLLSEVDDDPGVNLGERREYSAEDNIWPHGTASVKVESDVPLHSFVMVESNDGKALEAVLPSKDAALILTFPLIGREVSWWKQLTLMNTGVEASQPTVIALDKTGNFLAKISLPTLLPMASTTVEVGELFESSILASTAILQIVAGQPLVGFQLFGADDETDIAALPAFDSGQQLFLPVFQEGEGVALWTTVGLFNPRDGPVSLTVEAFDAQHRSIALVSDLTSLPAHSSDYLLSSNLGGVLPPETAFLKVSADQAVSGYAVIGSL